MGLKIFQLSEDSASFCTKTGFVFESDLLFFEGRLSDISKITLNNTNVIIVDYDSVKLKVFDFVRDLKQRSIEIPIIIIATQINDDEFTDLLNLDIYAYIEKDHIMNYVLANYLYDIKKSPGNYATS